MRPISSTGCYIKAVLLCYFYELLLLLWVAVLLRKQGSGRKRKIAKNWMFETDEQLATPLSLAAVDSYSSLGTSHTR